MKHKADGKKKKKEEQKTRKQKANMKFFKKQSQKFAL